MAHKDDTVRYGVGGYRTLHPMKIDSTGLNLARKDAKKQLAVMTAFQRELKSRLGNYVGTTIQKKDVFHEAEEALFKVLNP